METWRLVYDENTKEVKFLFKSSGHTDSLFTVIEFATKEEALQFIADNNLVYVQEQE